MIQNTPFTRQKKEKKNFPLILNWGVFLLVVILFFFFKVFPLFTEWSEKKDLLEEYKQEIPLLEKEISFKDADLLEIQNAFKDLATPFLITENQIYPEYIDIKKISKILELYSLQISLVENTPFEISKINFGAASKMEGKEYSRTAVDINFVSNEKMLREFIYFLQSGKISKKFEAARSTGQLDPRAYTFLKQNIMPIAQIQSIKIADDEVDGVPGQISANVQFYLFSRKSSNKE